MSRLGRYRALSKSAAMPYQPNVNGYGRAQISLATFAHAHRHFLASHDCGFHKKPACQLAHRWPIYFALIGHADAKQLHLSHDLGAKAHSQRLSQAMGQRPQAQS